MKTVAKLWIWVGVFAVLSPLGLILPKVFKGGDAWGEWDAEGINGLVGYIPAGFQKLTDLWKAPLPDYTFRGWEDKGLIQNGFAYVVSAVAGSVIIWLTMRAISRLLIKKTWDK